MRKNKKEVLMYMNKNATNFSFQVNCCNKGMNGPLVDSGFAGRQV